MDAFQTDPCDLRIGTAGYAFPSWEGVLYRKGLGRSQYAGAYSEVFGTLETGFTPASPPSREVVGTLLSATRRPIDLTLVAPAGLACSPGGADWTEQTRRFAEAAEAAAEAGRLCALLFRFPQSYAYADNQRRHLDKVLRQYASFPAVVEFHGAAWYTSRVIDGLKRRSVTLCSLDMPWLDGLAPVSDMVTAQLAYVRFLGRNTSGWVAGDASRRDYDYSADELRSWLSRIEAMCMDATRVRIVFDNRQHGHAPANALALAGIAGEAGLPVSHMLPPPRRKATVAVRG